MSDNVSIIERFQPQACGGDAGGGTLRKLIGASLADNTMRAYASRVKMFSSWCSTSAVGALPHFPASPSLVTRYIADMVDEGKTIATIEQTVAAISFFHNISGYENQDPTKNELVRLALKGARRTIGTAPAKKQPIRLPILRAIISGIDRSVAIGRRDAALILLGFAGAFRRSELVALDVADLSLTAAGDGRPAYEVIVRRGKTDQEAAGMTKGIFSAADDKGLCPVNALRDYLEYCNIESGPLFVRISKGKRIFNHERLSGRAVARILQRRAKNAGVELDVAGHSLRSGFITAAAEAGRTERSIQNQTGHKSVITLRGYIQRVNVLQDNAADGLI